MCQGSHLSTGSSVDTLRFLASAEGGEESPHQEGFGRVPEWYLGSILKTLHRNEVVHWAEKPPLSRCIHRDRSFHVIFFAGCFSISLAFLPVPFWWWIPVCVLFVLFSLYLAHRAYRRLDRCYVLTNFRFMMFRPLSLLSDTVVLYQSFDVEELAVAGILRCEHYSKQLFRTVEELADRDRERQTAARSRDSHVQLLRMDDYNEDEITVRGGCVYFFAQSNWRAVYHISNVRDLAEALRSAVALRLCYSPAIGRHIIEEKLRVFQQHGLGRQVISPPVESLHNHVSVRKGNQPLQLHEQPGHREQEGVEFHEGWREDGREGVLVEEPDEQVSLDSVLQRVQNLRLSLFGPALTGRYVCGCCAHCFMTCESVSLWIFFIFPVPR